MCIDLLDKAISSASLLVPVYALKKVGGVELGIDSFTLLSYLFD